MDQEAEVQPMQTKYQMNMNPPMGSMRVFPYPVHEMQPMKNYGHIDLVRFPTYMNAPPPLTSQIDLPPTSDANSNTIDSKVNLNKSTSGNLFLSEKQKGKQYLNYMVNAVIDLLKEGKITKEYLDEKTEPKFPSLNQNSIPPNGQVLDGSYLSTQSHCNCNCNNVISNSNATTSRKHKSSYDHSRSRSQSASTLQDQCEHPLCNYTFNSKKEKFTIKIKGLKEQEKHFCKKCYEAVKDGHFCYYCNAIYRDGAMDNAVWVQCDNCKNWVHSDCEVNKGKRYATAHDLEIVQTYMCPICLKANEKKMSLDNKVKKKLIGKKRRGESFDEQKNKKNKKKELRNFKNEKCSELLDDVQLIESIKCSK